MMNRPNPDIQIFNVSSLVAFFNHPFKVLFDESLLNLAESIKLHGLQTPIIVRKHKTEGLYEILSGHRRVEAVKLLGEKTIVGQVIDLDDENAAIFMIQSNNYRERILPSEKAYSYKMLLEAYKKQGKEVCESDLAFRGRSNERLAKEVKESVTQIKRFIRLTYLIQGLMDMVDKEIIALRPAVEFSYLSEIHQQWLYEFMCNYESTPTYSQAIEIKKLEKENLLTPETLLCIFETPKPNQKEKFVMDYNVISTYIPKEISPKQAQLYVIDALKYYNKVCSGSVIEDE